MQKKKNGFLPLNQILKKQLHQLADGKFKNTFSLEEKWKSIVGEMVAQNAKVLYIKGKVLHVGVKNSAWKCELGFMRQNLLDKIQANLPQAQVQDIRFKVIE